MRRGLASLIIGLSLIVASLSWASFTLSRTVLDPGRSERLADQLLENPDVRQALVVRMADALEAQIPPEVPVPRGVIEAGAATALDDPRVEELVRDGFVRVHQNALAGVDEPVTVDASALGAAGRDVLVELRPELEPFLPPTPAVEVELPTTGLSWIGSVKNAVDRFTGISALVALIGAVTAFVVARNRPAVLRRVAFWGYGASAFWLAVGYGIPRLAATLSPTSAAIASAAADVFFGAMIRPAIAMAMGATVLLLAGFILPTFQRRRGASIMQPRRQATGARMPAPAGRYQTPAVAPIDRTGRLPITPIPTGPAQPAANAAPITTRPVQPAANAAPTTPVAPRPQPSVLYGSDPAVTARAATTRSDGNQGRPEGSGDRLAAQPWRTEGSVDSTDPMPLPTWGDEPNRR